MPCVCEGTTHIRAGHTAGSGLPRGLLVIEAASRSSLIGSLFIVLRGGKARMALVADPSCRKAGAAGCEREFPGLGQRLRSGQYAPSACPFWCPTLPFVYGSIIRALCVYDHALLLDKSIARHRWDLALLLDDGVGPTGVRRHRRRQAFTLLLDDGVGWHGFAAFRLLHACRQ